MFLVDGTSGGLMTAEIMNWTGHVLKGTRDKLGEIRSRPEAQRTGVYILLGEDEGTGEKLAYIGQSDDVAKRLQQHDSKKTYWTDVVVVTSKDTNLTSAHVRYLEARLVRLAKAIGRVPLENGNEPSGGADLPEADASDMEYFIDQLRVLLPVLGVDLFRGRPTRSVPDGSVSTATLSGAPGEGQSAQGSRPLPLFHLRHKKFGVDAQAQVIDGEFTVLAGSVVRAAMPDRTNYSESSALQYGSRQEQHRKLLADGSLVVGGDGLGRLSRDVVFSSPSAAGAVVQGSVSINGRTAWATETGLSYRDWESGGAGPVDAD